MNPPEWTPFPAVPPLERLELTPTRDFRYAPNSPADLLGDFFRFRPDRERALRWFKAENRLSRSDEEDFRASAHAPPSSESGLSSVPRKGY